MIQAGRMLFPTLILTLSLAATIHGQESRKGQGRVMGTGGGGFMGGSAIGIH